MSDLISTYQWQLIEISDSEVLLKAGTYAIDVVADRDGVSMVYFDESSMPPKGYSWPAITPSGNVALLL